VHGVDQAKSEAFAGRLMEMINAAGTAMMISIGHRTGLFDVMSRMESAESAAIAERSGLSERYVREWLGAMTTAAIVEHDPAAGTYRLPAEHAAWLTRAAAPNNVGVYMQYIGVLGAAEDEVVQAFRHGKGVPYSSYTRFHEVMAEDSGQAVAGTLEEHLLPLVPGLRERLEQGIQVLDVGCGAGRTMVKMATLFPRSRFTGVDIAEEALERGRQEAAAAGLTNVRLVTGDAAELTEVERYDLITAFDAIHDQPRPAKVLENIRRALKPDGVYLMQDIKAHSAHHQNIGHPLGPFIYTVSCMHCMSVSLAAGGPGLGAAWGRELAEQMLHEAGFTTIQVNELAHDPTNYWYVVRKD
jgi:2-polyprenyl-3-methyl-5-hydroxy-6-metoxy-1,4-benzoquinol methylase